MSHLLKAVVLLLIIFVSTTHATPITGQGTWENTLKARDINGNAVALDSLDAAFFYDTTLNITWLADMNYARTSGYHRSGQMTWTNSVAWANSLTVGGYTDWRLPYMQNSEWPFCHWRFFGTDCGYNVNTKIGDTVYSELAHLFYVTLGNHSLCIKDEILGPDVCDRRSEYGLANDAYFKGMQNYRYWTGLEDTYMDQQFAWLFGMDDGSQLTTGQSDEVYAIAVRSGDVLKSSGNTGTIPLPAPIGLLVLGLAALGLHRRQAGRHSGSQLSKTVNV